MAEATMYKCPKCAATLKPPAPVPAGKKIKCPKCATIFAPTAEPPKAAAAAKPAAGKPAVEEDEGGLYALKDEPPPPEPAAQPFIEEDEDDAKPRKKKQKQPEVGQVEKDLLAKQSPKRKKGAAQAICQKPSNQMLATSSFACVSCIISLLVALWPIVFTQNKSWYTVLVGIEKFPIMVWIGLLVAAFLYNGFIASGAVKMQSVESYGTAMLAAMLTAIPVSWLLAIPAFGWFYKILESILGPGNMMVYATILCIGVWYLYVGMWNMKTLRDPDVIAGFSEKDTTYGDT